VEDLQWHVKNPCPPDVIGVNHYISSERFLDHRLEHHAPDTHGGNGKDRYADVLAARVREEGCDGFQGMLTETWERYGIPIAVTECHMGCTREEQMRWLVEGWRAAHRVREDGADIVGFTVWSLTGAFDWNCLLTQWTGCYEPGVFDLRAPSPRPTALAMVMKSLAKGKVPDHPALDNVGWWERPSRFEHPPVSTGGRAHAAPRTESVREDRPILITGASGTLGRAFARECAVRGLAYRLLSRSDMDISEPASVERAIAEHRPWLVVNTAGYVHVDRAEADSVRCYRENTAGPAVLAGACLKSKARLVTFSSDLLFDGTQSEPYTESDSPNPLGMYGRSKLEAERCVLSAMPEALVVRTSAFFSPHDVHNFVHNVLWTLKSGQAFYATPGQVVSPTYVPDLVSATLDLLIDGESGIWHLANMGEVSWFDFARAAAKAAGLDPYEVRPIQLPEDARRPAYSALASERGWVMPTLESALERYIKALATVPTPASNFAWL
jgi:dTDP-4-dehydrorhamnose reductase